MNTRNEVFAGVCAAVGEALSLPEAQLSESSLVQGDLEATSMDIVTVAICLDDRFQVDLDLSDLPTGDFSIGWIVDYIHGKLR